MEDKKEFRDILEVEGVKAKGFGIIPKLAMLDRKLTVEAKAIYSYFCSYAGAGSTAFPSVEKIRGDLCLGKDRYYKHFKLLKDYGYIKVTQKKGTSEKFSHNVYTLVENPVKKPCPDFKDTVGKVEKPCPDFPDTDKPTSENKDTNNNKSFIKNNSLLYNNQSVIEKEKRKDRLTDVKIDKNVIIEQAQIELYKGDHRKLLESTIEKLLKLQDIKVNHTVLNSNQIREQLNKLNINIIDFTFKQFREIQAEKEIKNRAKYFQVLLLNCIDEYSANNIYE